LSPTSNGFGRLAVDPYPYRLEIHWDGKQSHDQAEVPSWGTHKYRLQELWNMQLRPDVVRMKAVRLQLRGAAAGQELYNPHERDEDKTRQLKDGKDEEGKQKYKTEYYTIHWKYHQGQVTIKSDFGENVVLDGQGNFDQGFDVSMWYHDGQGVETNGSQKGTTHKAGVWNMKSDQMGINHTNYQMTDALHRILTQSPPQEYYHHCSNALLVEQGIERYNEKLQQFRQKNLRERYWENYALSWSFWYLIYNNDMISLPQMNTHFNTIEQNPKLRNVVGKYTKELTAITEMIAYFNTHPCVGYWYTYWNDVYKMNADLPGIKANEDMFNSAVSTSICFKPMGRKETEAFLSSAKGKAPLGKNQKAHLDLLFAQVDAIKKKHPMKTVVGNPVFVPVVMATVAVADYVVPVGVPPVADSSSVWVGFAKSPVAATANPTQSMTVVDCYGVVETNAAAAVYLKQVHHQQQQQNSFVMGFSRGNVNEIGVHTTQKCSQGHGLIRFNTPTAKFGCDPCGKRGIPINSVMYGCDTCNYDVCASCAGTDAQDFSDSDSG